jgi:redox-sensitive bicupin YhaK (pirin superfamily)
MTAGRGIVHAEMPKGKGDNYGLQLWHVIVSLF